MIRDDNPYDKPYDYLPSEDKAESLVEPAPELFIDLRRLKPGVTVLCNTNLDVYEMKVLDPVLLLVEIIGTDNRLRVKTRGQFLNSFVGFNKSNTRNGCIVKDGRLVIDFKNGRMETSPILSAKVCGDEWSYEVF